MEEQKHIISCLVENHSGVLTKISGLFSRRGYNIESLSVCQTEDENLSRMTIVAKGNDYILEQITKQLDKLPDVVYIANLYKDESVTRELLLLKLKNDPDKLSQVMEITKVYKAKTVDLSPNSLVLELTGDSQKIDAFIKLLQHYGILEMARSGITALYREEKCLKNLSTYEEKI